MWRLLMAVTLALFLAGCSTAPPRNPHDLCEVFREKGGWYEDAVDSRKTWGSPISTMMAIIFQESAFKANAKPPRKKILGFIPGSRVSSSYGYSQAKKGTWADYKRSAGRYGADRDDFGDAIDFVGWYNAQSHTRNGISLRDPYALYLAYHEGHGGYSRGTYRQKSWVTGVARKVEARAQKYRLQLLACEDSLEDDGWFFGLF